MSKIFYPPCQWLDPNTRDAKGHFYCEFRHAYVRPALSCLDVDREFKFNRSHCAPDCLARSGKTRVPTL